ncbi:hypothetical protein [Marinococcus sp. PL1-022]|uniref:hypothetical protein n=1 Tax=Marinococcus sp. PL1-022 TaxID=3095363 RepID=UPI0029C2CB8E|nr:hypothetical protein [Marinococcus sp. PL1-022]MDX6154510.1 hypothetical protein [Marinococcus sp. PL1-022]
MSAKQRKNYMLSEQTIAYIDKVKEQQGISASAALHQIVEEHRDQEWRQELSNYLIDKVADEVQDRLHDDLKKIRIGANTADRKTSILLEVMNVLMIHHDLKDYVSTAETLSPVLDGADEYIADTISKAKQRKDSRN